MAKPFTGNEYTKWGQDLEPEAVRAYQLVTGKGVDHSADLGELAGAPWLGASPDGLVLDGRGVLEVKCPAVRAHASL